MDGRIKGVLCIFGLLEVGKKEENEEQEQRDEEDKNEELLVIFSLTGVVSVRSQRAEMGVRVCKAEGILGER